MRKVLLAVFTFGAAAWAAAPGAPSPAAGPLPPAAPSPAAADDNRPVPPAVVTSGVPGDASSAGAGEVVLLSSTESGCIFEVTIPEPRVSEVEAGGRRFERFSLPYFLATGDVGEPELLMRRVHVAAPPEAHVSVEVERVSFDVRTGVDLYPRPRLKVEERHGEQTLSEEFAYDAVAYREGTYPAKFAELEGEDVMRGYRLISVAVYPYQYQPAAGTLRVVKSVVVRVSFRGGVRRPNARYPARPAEDGIFTRVVPAVVLNHEVASRWPFAGGIAPARDGDVWPTDFAGKAAVKVVVEEEALYRLSYAELKATGLPVDTLNPANLRFFAGPAKRLPRDFNYEPPGLTELPIYVAGQGDGRFDASDYVEFYGHGCDFFEHIEPGENGAQKFSKNRFTRYNFYWLVADAVPGKRMTAAAVAPTGGTKPAYFWDRLRLEEDNQDVAETENAILEEDEYWYWRIFNAPTGPSRIKSFTFKDPVNGAGAPKTYLQIMVREQEGLEGNGPHHTIVYLNYPDKNHIIFEEDNYKADVETYFHRRFPSRHLIDGQNRLYFEEVGDRAPIDFIMLDHFEFEYPRHFRAYQDYLHFSNPPGTNGKVLFEIPGFTTDDLVVYDVTRGRRLAAFEVKAAGNEYTLRFTDDIPSGQRWYVAASPSAARKPRDVYLDAGSKLRDVDENVDLVVVVYDGYYDNVMPLVNLRRAAGLNVLVARVTDVYDEYSWGLYDPGATRLLVKDVYRKAIYRPGGELPDHLFLVGDAYLDHRDNYGNFANRELWREFGRNQVPTYYINTSSSGRTSSDNYFVAMSASLAPDLAVGRFPAPFDDNIDAIVEKVVAYERHAANGPWNNRVILVADNDDKTESGGGRGDFTRDNENLEEEFTPLGFEVRKEYIEWLTRRFPVDRIEETGFDFMSRGERQYWVGRIMKPDFLKGFNGIIMHYAGHGGPQVWSHENLFLHHKDLPPVDDVDALENAPYLPVIIQCSCSTAYFDQWYGTENEPLDFGQCISEYILQVPRKGGVAALGSTRLGYEGAQHAFLQSFYGYVFPKKKARWSGVTVGEAHLVGKIKVGETIRDMFVLLGDPSMTLATPRPGLKLTPNKAKVKRGEKVKVAGTVPNNFNGKAVVQLFDRPWYFYSGDMDRDIYRDRLLATTDVEVLNGRFDATLVVPTMPVNPIPSFDAGPPVAAGEAAPAGAASAAADNAAAAAEGAGPPAPAAASPYRVPSLAPVAEDGVVHVKAVAYGTGFRRVYVCNEDVTVNVAGEVSSGDNVGPDIDVYLNDYSFRSGDPTDPTPTLLVDVRDESGVLVARNLEAIDKDKGERTFVPFSARITKPDPKSTPTVLDLTYYYKAKVGDYRGGSVEKEISLADGVSTIAVTAYDSLGNKSQRKVQCVVSGALGMAEVMNCPNPFKDDTYFTFVASSDVDSLVIKIYTATGRLIQKLETGGLPAGYNQIHWDGRDGDGDRIANGVYFYKIIARAGGEKIVARQKMFKLR